MAMDFDRTNRRRLGRRMAGIALVFAPIAGLWAQQPAPAGQAPANPIAMPTAPGGPYLARTALPDSIALLPPPPAAGSAAEARDLAQAKAAHALRGKARWQQATRDADLTSPRATGAFSCAAGREISPTATPLTDRLLRRTLIDFASATSAAKNKYQRQRPFMVDGQPLCTPEAEAGLRTNGSYPSGHAAIGQGWGIVLGALLPAHRTALLARGRAFGDSRRVCNVHWASDVTAGQRMAEATYLALRSDPAFAADMVAARAELARLKPIVPACATERTALRLHR